MSSMIEQLEQEIADRLLSDPFFEDLEVLVVKKGNLVQEIQSRLAKQKILVAPVVTSAGCKRWDLQTPYFTNISITVGVFERVILNTTGKSCKAISERTHCLLHMWTPDSLNASIKSTENALEPQADDVLNIINNNFTTEGGLSHVLPQIATPVLTKEGNQVTLTCATPGAAIFYRLDGLNASPRKGTLYTAPFQVQPGAQVSARAWLAGFQTSEVLKQTV